VNRERLERYLLCRWHPDNLKRASGPPCELTGANAFDYLNQLQVNAADVTKHPDRWLPWNYLENVGAPSDAA
jgi:hypothetical protein